MSPNERPEGRAARRALFLDRDGVINADHGFVGDRARFDWRHGVFDLARAGRRAGCLLIVITNQSGIARGMFSEDDFAALTAWMEERFNHEGAPLAAVYHCPYHPQAKIERYRADHPSRKPYPGMILAARDQFDLDLGASTLVGDQWTDIEAGRTAGVGICALVGDAQRSRCPDNLHADAQLKDIEEAAAWFAALNDV